MKCQEIEEDIKPKNQKDTIETAGMKWSMDKSKVMKISRSNKRYQQYPLKENMNTTES